MPRRRHAPDPGRCRGIGRAPARRRDRRLRDPRLLELSEEDDVGAIDIAAALVPRAAAGAGDVAGAIQSLEGPYEAATDDGARARRGLSSSHWRTQSRSATRRLPRDLIEALNERSGGTYSDPDDRAWAERHRPRADRERRRVGAASDAAHAIATATDARLEHAIAALARACVLEALDDDRGRRRARRL